ncbi:MAG: 2-oxoglutarate synthase subunit alpha [Chloroflexi bacterium RBG_16_57_9]|nr:MAG: 2-oxoglutarate synthase subunit alpha [Chloroflexi bacterium RBG_16_57_9]
MPKKTKKIRSLQGNQVIALAAVDAGCRFFAGYPITPSSEIAAVLAEELPKVGGAFIQMEDEIASMGAIIGASLAGAKAMTATSGPGFSLKQENLGFACIAETPCVIVNIMRGGPSTGLPTLPSQSDVMQARWGTHGDHEIIALCPADLNEAYWLTVRAFNLAEKYRTPVVILGDEILAHMSERVDFPDPADLEIIHREKPPAGLEDYRPYAANGLGVPILADFFEGYRYHVTGLTHDEYGFPTEDPVISEAHNRRLIAKIQDNIDDIVEVEEYKLNDAQIAIFAYGTTARAAKAAILEARAEGIKVGMLRAMTLWPFPEKQVKALAKRVPVILVPEMNLGQMIREVERVVAGKAEVIGVQKSNGTPVNPSEILERIYAVAGAKKELALAR